MSKQSLPDKEYRTSFTYRRVDFDTNERVDSNDRSDWEEDFDENMFGDVINFN